MKHIFLYCLFCGLCYLYITEPCMSAEPQNPSPDHNIQSWLQNLAKRTYLPGTSYACSMNRDSSVLAIGNNIDRIWCLDISDKCLVSVIHHGFGGFVDARFVVSNDGKKLAVRNNLPSKMPQEIKNKLPKEFLENDCSKRTKSFWVYDIQDSKLIRQLDTVVVPYIENSGHILGDVAVSSNDKTDDKDPTGAKKINSKHIVFADKTVKSDYLSPYAPFCFSGDSESLVTWILRDSSENFHGVLAEAINIKSNDLQQLYVYSDVAEEMSKWRVGTFDPMQYFASSGDGRYLMFYGFGHHFGLFDADTSKVIYVQQPLYALATAHGCFKLNYDGSLGVYQTSSIKTTHPKSIELISGDDGDFDYRDLRGCRAVIFDTKTTKIKFEIFTPDPLIITDIAFSKDDRYIAAGTIWGHVFVWNVEDRKLIKHFSLSNNQSDMKDMTTTVIGFYKDTDEIIAAFIERYNKSAQIYKYKVSTDKSEKLFDFPP